jgi:hypothetical protein
MDAVMRGDGWEVGVRV